MNRTFSSSIHLLALTATLASVSCGTRDIPAPAPQRVLYQWHDEGEPGKVSVHISLTDQIAEFKRGNRDIGWCYVATGKEGHDTRPGNYRIMEKIEDKHSNLYGWIEDEFGNVVNGDAQPSTHVPKGMVYVPAPMPYWMRLTSYGVGMHGGLIPEPGKPASHGCIRMPKDFVPLLFNVVEVGTPVTITNARSRRAEPPETTPAQPLPPFEGDRRVIATRPLRGYQAPPPLSSEAPRANTQGTLYQ
jgi:hypothetical protein